MRCRPHYIAFVALSILLISCDLFNTRDPDEPDSANQTLPIAFTEDVLYSNFKKSFQEKNSNEYSKLFSDTSTHPKQFIFIPSASAGTRYSFSSWDKDLENEYFRNIISSVGSSSSFGLWFTNEIGPSSLHDSATYTFAYTLFVPHKRSDIPQQFTGNGEIYISPDKNAIWRIYRWVDFETKKDSSWSELKGQFAK